MPSQITIGKWTIVGSNHQELLGLKKEIFHEGRYDVDLDTETPIIIDAGAHVGLASLYFKSCWPQAKITCIEPFPENIQYLKQNLWQNRFEDITVVEAALAEKAGETEFYFDNTEDEWYSTAGFCENAWNQEQQSNSIVVPTVTLKSLVTEPVDLLKLDIEGAETAVLESSVEVLPLIHHLVVEYHPHPKQNWRDLMYVLKKNRFVPTEVIPPNVPNWLRNYHFINQTFKR